MTHINVYKVWPAWRDMSFVHRIPDYKSLMWVERNKAHGECMIKVPFDKLTWNSVELEYILEIPQSQDPMIVKSKKFNVEEDGELIITIVGVSLSAHLQRRIIPYSVHSRTYPTAWIGSLLYYGFADGSAARKAENVGFYLPEEINGGVVQTDYTRSIPFGKNLWEALITYIKPLPYRLRVHRIPEETGQLFKMQVSVTTRLNRALGYSTTNTVISPSRGNMQTYTYLEDTKGGVTDAYVSIENEGKVDGRWEEYGVIGLSRFEDTLDLSQLSSDIFQKPESYKDADGNTVQPYYNTDPKAHRDLWFPHSSAAARELVDASPPFNKEADVTVVPNTIERTKDYELGDWVSVVDPGGRTFTAEVNEIVISDEGSGLEIYPRLSIIKES